jgi:cytochrome c-type protein NapB
MMENEMKKKIVTVLAVCVVMMFTGGAIAGAVDSLRLGQDIQDMSKNPAKKKQMVVEGGKINLKGNTCMNCHSEKTYEKKKAPKAGDTHYVTRDGKVTETVASRRYFCDQCHAPQVNAEPLVENTFQGAK